MTVTDVPKPVSKSSVPIASAAGAQSYSNETSTTEASKEFEVMNPISSAVPAAGKLFGTSPRENSKESINLLDDNSSVENLSKEVSAAAAPAI